MKNIYQRIKAWKMLTKNYSYNINIYIQLYLLSVKLKKSKKSAKIENNIKNTTTLVKIIILAIDINSMI